MSNSKYVNIPAFAKGVCVSCCKISELQIGYQLCNRCRELVCDECRIPDYISGLGGHLCINCFAPEISPNQSKVLICLARGYKAHRIAKRFRMRKRVIREHIDLLVRKQYLEVRRFGFSKSIRVTDLGENVAASALSAYSKFPNFRSFVAEVTGNGKR